MTDTNYLEISNKTLLVEKVYNFFKNTKKNIKKLELTNDGKININHFNSYLVKIEHKPNLYGICIKKDSEEWIIKYIGQRKSEGIRQRLREHLFYCNKNTGSKYDDVKNCIKEGCSIGIILFSIQPEQLRHYYEEMLIRKIKTNEWNIQENNSKKS